MLYTTTGASGTGCTEPDTVGSLDHNEIPIHEGVTYILDGYTVQCEGIVTTWEFCYRIQNTSIAQLVTGIWNITGFTGNNAGNPIYSLIQSNTVTFTPSGVGPSFSCQNYTLPITERFSAPSGSVVGLYATTGATRPLLLRSANSEQITTYQITGNKSTVEITGNGQEVNYNIAIRVHFGKLLHLYIQITIMCHDYN